MSSFLGSIGDAITGAVSGFLGTGSPWGAVAGAGLSLLGGSGGGGGGSGGGGGGQVGTYIPPTTQEAYNIIKGLEGQVGNVASSEYNIVKPYLEEAYSLFENQPTTFEELFNAASQDILSRYSDLFNNVQSQMQNQWSKKALGLSALGMYNTPATQLTQSDIVNQLYGRVAEAQAQDLIGLNKSKLNAYLNYYEKAPAFLSTFGETLSKFDPTVNQYKLQLGLANALQGITDQTVLYPKTTPLQQISNQLNDYIKNNAKSLPSISDVFNGVGSIFSGGSYSFSSPSASYGWSNALNNALPVPNIFG